MKRENIYRFMHGVHLDEKPTKTDQQKGFPLPAPEKNIGSTKLIKLPEPLEVKIKKTAITKCIQDRKSTRRFGSSPLSLKELSFLLWATQGIKRVREKMPAHHAVRRTVPSGGSRHPFETYIIVQNVTGLKKGIYRYVASVNSLVIVKSSLISKKLISEAVCGQVFCTKAPVLFVWAALPYRTEWRYGAKHAIKTVLLDAGHVGQNLHLACEALGLGTCMIGAYRQTSIDKIIGVDGKEEFSVYLAPVGKY